MTKYVRPSDADVIAVLKYVRRCGHTNKGVLGCHDRACDLAWQLTTYREEALAEASQAGNA